MKISKVVLKRCIALAASFGCYAGSGSLLAAEDGVGVAGGVTVVGQAITNKKVATNDPGEYPGGSTLDDGIGVTYSLDLEFEKEMESGTAFVYLVGAEGDPVYDGANADGEGGFSQGKASVAEAWYAHNFGDWVTFTLGKIDPVRFYDASEVANDPTSQFLADAFVNNPAILFPAYTPGMNFTLHLGDVSEIHFGIFEEDAPEVEAPAVPNVRIAGEMQYKFIVGEVDFFFEPFDQETNLRFTGWNSESANRAGFAFNLDQTMGDMFTLYSRFGFISGAKGAETSTAFSIGGQLAFEDGHTIGVAYSADIPEGKTLTTQSWFESYVSFQVAEETFITLDAQFVGGPGYDKKAKAVGILGFRAQANF